MGAKDAVGRYGENVAARHLVEAGLEVVDRNWRCAAGEIDIVAREGGVVVICEVKTRSSTAFGAPQEAVTPVKAARLRELALWWLREHPCGGAPVRFDVVSVLRSPRGAAAVQHLRGAF
ncbi:MAG TPA: YraN family protein [Mycobacteriales bacterium]|nr:YraN family protein [Mycobacteriales bacterium]